MKKLLTLLLTAIVLSTSIAMANTKITVKVNGSVIDLKDAPAFVDKSNRTLVPIRFIADNLGADTDWNQLSQTATVKKDGKTIEICIPCKKVKIDGQEIGTDSYGQLKNSRTYVPLRLIAEAFGAQVGYSNGVVTIDTANSNNPYNPDEYVMPDVSKMNVLDKTKELQFSKMIPSDRDGFTGKLYDGANWDWNVQLIKEGVGTDGFAIKHTTSKAGALYVILTDGTWARANFPYPSGAAFFGNHVGKTIDKVLFLGGGEFFLVDIEDIKIEK